MPEPSPNPPQIRFDDANASATYANFCRVTGTPEEIIIDFGLNPQPVGTEMPPITANNRVVMGLYTAKRMMLALQTTVQRHEQAFGTLEIDVQKRVRQ
ncbi:MAG: DUF3467 domain-containing protein [Planctomycetaceae bacterium]|jgi:hypothetical protein|nr:DUF3467 domain-containing protein [Planctomycetaceae bacterium]